MRAHRIAAVLAIVLVACDGDRQTTAVAGGRADRAEQIGFGVRHKLVTNGIRRGDLRADSALFYDGGNRIELRGVQLTLFGASQDTVSTATARSATYTLRTKRVTLYGGVSVRARDGRQLVASRATYDATTARISGDSAYTLSGTGGGPTTGVGFDVDVALRAVRAPSRVRPRAP